MAHKISVDDVEKRDRDGGLRFSAKSYQKVSNPDYEESDLEGPEELENQGEDEMLPPEDNGTELTEHTLEQGSEVTDFCKTGSRIGDLCPDLSDDTNWFTFIKDKHLAGLCIKDFDNILFNDIDEAEKFYSYYSFMVGFSWKRRRLDTKLVDGVETIVRRSWACSKEGSCVPKKKEGVVVVDAEDADFDENELGVAEENEKGKGPHLVKGKRTKKTVGRERKYSRTGCKAFLSIKPHKDTGKFKVSRFSTIHNHELADIFERHFLRSHRKVTLQDILEVKALHEADVNTSDAFNYLSQQSGGRAFVGFMLKDVYNKLHNYKQLNSQYGDAEAAMNWLRIRGSEEEKIFCRYIRDSKKRLAGLFWRDNHSLMDYELYGDVLVIDATYKTNVYGMPLVLFVGANNHRATMVFACALICNEKDGTYDWVVKNSLKP